MFSGTRGHECLVLEITVKSPCPPVMAQRYHLCTLAVPAVWRPAECWARRELHEPALQHPLLDQRSVRKHKLEHICSVPIRSESHDLHGQSRRRQATMSSYFAYPSLEINYVPDRVRTRNALGTSEQCTLHLAGVQVDKCFVSIELEWSASLDLRCT